MRFMNKFNSTSTSAFFSIPAIVSVLASMPLLANAMDYHCKLTANETIPVLHVAKAEYSRIEKALAAHGFAADAKDGDTNAQGQTLHLLEVNYENVEQKAYSLTQKNSFTFGLTSKKTKGDLCENCIEFNNFDSSLAKKSNELVVDTKITSAFDESKEIEVMLSGQNLAKDRSQFTMNVEIARDVKKPTASGHYASSLNLFRFSGQRFQTSVSDEVAVDQFSKLLPQSISAKATVTCDQIPE
jgi:hypothetical protein